LYKRRIKYTIDVFKFAMKAYTFCIGMYIFIHNNKLICQFLPKDFKIHLIIVYC